MASHDRVPRIRRLSLFRAYARACHSLTRRPFPALPVSGGEERSPTSTIFMDGSNVFYGQPGYLHLSCGAHRRSFICRCTNRNCRPTAEAEYLYLAALARGVCQYKSETRDFILFNRKNLPSHQFFRIENHTKLYL